MIKVFKVTQTDFLEGHYVCKTCRQVEDIVGTLILNDDNADECGSWWPGEVTIKIELVDMDEAEYEALEDAESFGE